MFWRNDRSDEAAPAPRYPGVPEALDGSTAVVEMETAASEAAGAYPITPSTQMGEGWALAVAAGKPNVNGRRLLFFEPEGEHAAAAVTAGMSLVGLRATNFSSGQGIAYMHESLYAAVGKRLTYVLNVAARAMTKQGLNVHAGHDDYHCVDDTGFFQLFAKDVQEAADLTLIAHRIAELALNPGIVAQDGFLTSHVIESIRLPERELIREYLGDPADHIPTPTPAQKMVFGDTRRRIPELFDYDYPALLGSVQNQDSYAQGVAAQRPFYFDHVAELTEVAFAEFAALTGRRYERAMGYRMDDAEWVLAGQGSVVANAEAVADWLRETRGLKVGVLNLTMFRPFPTDVVVDLLRRRHGVTVLERTDQPLAVDPPLMREIRAAMSQALENGRAYLAGEPAPYPRVSSVRPEDVPNFFSAGFGFGSRDLQPGDLVAAVENMLPGEERRRQYYLGIDFIRKDTRLPKLQIWQERILEGYPHLGDLSLPSAGNLDLMPPGTVSLRMHSVGGWGAITTGKNLALTCFELMGLHVKANPKYGSEKKGQPTTFYATLSRQPVKLNAELRHVDVVLSPDPNVFRHSDPLAGLKEGGVFVIQSDHEPEALWRSLPERARRAIRERNIRFFALDGFAIASSEASDADLRYRMQGAAFMGAFFAAAPLAAEHGLDEDRLMEGIRAQLEKKFGKLGARVVEDNFRVIRRGYDELRPVPTDVEVEEGGESAAAMRPIPSQMVMETAEEGIGNQGRFFEQTCSLYAAGQDPIADPFMALSAMPAATSAVRDMTGIRFEVPEFLPELCTGCAQCWTQCPDAAIPGLVNTVESLIDTAVAAAGESRPVDRVRQVSKHLAREARKTIGAMPKMPFGEVVASAYRTVADKLGWEPERRVELDREFAAVHSILAEFKVAHTTPFYDVPERKEKGSGGLLSITINPEACKGCNICVDVCHDGALVTVRQDEEIVDRLRRTWKFWERLPDTDDRYVNVSDVEEGIGVLSSLLLKKDTYRSMAGGDGACMGCGEKTTAHLVVSTIEALMQPRVKRFVTRLDEMIAGLDAKARGLLSAGADLGARPPPRTGGWTCRWRRPAGGAEAHHRLHRRAEGPALALHRGAQRPRPRQRGDHQQHRLLVGVGEHVSLQPVPVPLGQPPLPGRPVHRHRHLRGAHAEDGGRVHRRSPRGEAARRRVRPGRGRGGVPGARLARLHRRRVRLCPPLLVIGGDGAMLDIGFQNLSRLLASGKPIRVMVLDTQVYSNTGGQASTATYLGQTADMTPFGNAQRGKEETRKELSLIAIAHRGTYVLQSSQANASHLIGGVLKGLQTRRPAVFNIYSPCPVEHGLPDEWAPQAARLALESRAFPLLTYDPDAGPSLADCLSLEGNPSVEDRWPTYELEYLDDAGAPQRMELPVTIADWAATEVRFKKQFGKIPADMDEDDLVPFHEFVAMPVDEREGKRAYIHVLGKDRRLSRLAVSREMVELAEERLQHWSLLREMAGLEVSDTVRDRIAERMEEEFEGRLSALRTEYEAKLAELQTTYPRLIARRLAEGLVRSGDGDRSIGDLLRAAEAEPGVAPHSNGTAALDVTALLGTVPAAGARAPVAAPAAPPAPVTAAAAAPALADAPAADCGGRGRRAADDGPVRRDGALHHLQRVHEHQQPAVQVRREQAGVHRRRARGHLRADRPGGGEVPRRHHPPGHSAQSEGEGPGEVGEAGRAVQLNGRGAKCRVWGQ
jgi:pyruvate-ferredoxin/flavodoxin oxidoreductase